MSTPPVNTLSSTPEQRIVAGARKHFLAEGFRNVTMDALAVELGMSKKTLYAHFASKTDLVKAVMLQKLDQAETELEAVTSSSQNGFAKTLQELLACIQRHTDEIRPPFLRDVRRDTPELFEVVQERRAGMIHKHFVRMLNSGRRAGRIRKDVPVALIVEMLVGATHAIVNPARLADLCLTPKAAFEAIISVVLDGVLIEPKGDVE